MMTDVAIRDLEPADFDRGFLETLAVLSTVELDAAGARQVFTRLAPTQHIFVATADGQVVGTTSLLVEQKFIHSGGLVGHVEDVAVRAEYQKRGIGTKLVWFAVQRAREAGCYKVILECFPAVQPFYERLGFRDCNRGLRLDLNK